MRNLIIYGEPHYRQNYLDQILLDELTSSTPDELKVVMLDPSIDSLSEFEGLPYLLFPVCVGGQIRDALSRLCGEMQDRIGNGVSKPTILIVADRWLPKGDLECPHMLESIIAGGKTCGIYVWCSFDDPDIIPEELRARVDSFYAKQGSFNFDDDIYDKCLDMTKKYQEKYGEIMKTN